MSSYNKVILIGNLTRDPEIRQTPSGQKVADLRLAVSETWKDRATGAQKEVSCFVDVVAWEKLADFCGQYFTKGRPMLVEGRLQMDEWETQQGEKRSKLRVRAETIRFVGPAPQKADGAPQPAAPAAGAPRPAPQPQPPAGGDLAEDAESLPF